MKFLTIKDLVSNQKKSRELIGRVGSVITLNGKPIALTIPVNEDNFEYVLNETAMIGFKTAVKSIQERSEKLGITEADVEREIKEYRKERAKKRSNK